MAEQSRRRKGKCENKGVHPAISRPLVGIRVSTGRQALYVRWTGRWVTIILLRCNPTGKKTSPAFGGQIRDSSGHYRLSDLADRTRTMATAV